MDTDLAPKHTPQPDSIDSANQSENDVQLEAMRAHMISLFPDMTDKIKVMKKDDLLQIIEAQKPTKFFVPILPCDPPQVKNEVEQMISRDKMVEEILAKLPDMKDDLIELEDADIKQVYDQLTKTVQSGKLPQKQIRQVEIVCKPPETKKSTLSISQMRERLIQNLQEYQSQFQNLDDSQIVVMYESLEEQEKKRKRKCIQEESQSVRNNKRLKSEVSKTDIKQKQLKSKKQAKLLKQKHKCKVTFYFDPEDFEINVHSQQSRKMGLSKICEALQKVFAKK